MKNQILKRVLILSLVLALAPVFSLGAKDFGILLDQSVSFDDSLDFKYSATLIPWFSTPMGKRSDFFISAGVSAGYEFNEWKIIPELLRTEFLFNMAESGELKIGRFFYSDPLGFVASGLFDGVYYSVDIGEVSTIGTGLWYTGFLYKKNANIAMTQDEANTYAEPVDYSDFYRTYFAPGRLVFAFDWQHPGIKELIRFDLALVAQIDLFGGASGYHSQYLIGKAVLPVKNFVFDIGICAELAENSGQAELSFAGELEIDWYLPTKIYDRLSFLGRFSTGVLNSIMRSFEPITTVSHGGILKAKLAGISMLRLEYTARGPTRVFLLACKAHILF